MRKLISFLLVLFSVSLLWSMGQKDEGTGVILWDDKGVNDIAIDSSTITTIRTSGTAGNTTYVYSNYNELGLAVHGFTDVCFLLKRSERHGEPVYISRGSHQINAQIAYGEKDLNAYASDLPEKDVEGRILKGFYLTPECLPGTMLFDEKLFVIKNKTIRYIDEETSVTQIVTYTDADGWVYSGGHLTLYAKWEFPEPLEENTVYLHWDAFPQGAKINRKTEKITMRKGDTVLPVTLPDVINQPDSFLEGHYIFMGFVADFEFHTVSKDAIIWGYDSVKINRYVPTYTSEDHKWACSRPEVHLYGVWGRIKPSP